MENLMCTIVACFLFFQLLQSQPEMTLWVTPEDYPHIHNHGDLQAYPCDSTYYISYHHNTDTIAITIKNEGNASLILTGINAQAIAGAMLQIDGQFPQEINPGEMQNLDLVYHLPANYVSGINGSVTFFSNDPTHPSCAFSLDVGCPAPEWVITESDTFGVDAVTCDEFILFANNGNTPRVIKFLGGDSTLFYQYDSNNDTSLLSLFLVSQGMRIPGGIEADNFLHAGIDRDLGRSTFSVELGSAKVKGIFEVETLASMSDIRMKKDFQPIQDGVNTIMKLHPSTYFWTDNPVIKERQYGFSAQEVEEILPELVYTNDENLKSVNYLQMIPWLTAALQEQQDIIDKLEKRIAELERN